MLQSLVSLFTDFHYEVDFSGHETLTHLCCQYWHNLAERCYSCQYARPRKDCLDYQSNGFNIQESVLVFGDM